MFTEADRSRLLEVLIARARADPAVDAAAVVGSAARGATDAWSDIDLALGLADGAEVTGTATAWTRALGEVVDVADTLDLWAGPVLYRVFLLHDTLQVDLSFWPAGTLAATGDEPLALVFGRAATPTPIDPPDPSTALGWGWLYALHARSAIARGRGWQAVQMLGESLAAAHAAAVGLLAGEAERLDAELAARLRAPLATLRTMAAASPPPPAGTAGSVR